MIISQGDLDFLKRAMARLNIRKPIRVYKSDSKKKWPDIWVIMGKDPVEIWVTREWASQNVHERRKRLTHELAGHIAFSWDHMEDVGFSTKPERDTMSWRIYRDILKGRVKPKDEYIREARNG